MTRVHISRSLTVFLSDGETAGIGAPFAQMCGILAPGPADRRARLRGGWDATQSRVAAFVRGSGVDEANGGRKLTLPGAGRVLRFLMIPVSQCIATAPEVLEAAALRPRELSGRRTCR